MGTLRFTSRIAPLILGFAVTSLALAAPDAGAPAPSAKSAPTAAPVPTAKTAPAPTPTAKTAPTPAAKPAPAATPAPAPKAAPTPPATKPAAAPPTAKAAPPVTAAPTPVNPAALASGVVVIERANRTLGLGTVLNGDGRILTALSALGDARNVDARYADGSVVPARLGHADRARDLALLVPQSSQKRHGLRASRKANAEGTAALKSFAVAGNKAAPGAGVTPTAAGTTVFQGSDGKALSDVVVFAAPLPETSTGSPLIDDSGEVLAVVTHACRRTQAGCVATLVGMPVGSVRDFLQKAPQSAAIPTSWIGVDGVADDSGSSRGVRALSVRGPAATAGIRAGKDAKTSDMIVAVDAQPVTTPEALKEVVEGHAVGDALDLLVLGGGRFRHVTLVVVAAPR